MRPASASTEMLERIYGKPDGEALAKAMTRSIAVGRAALTLIEGGNSGKSPTTAKKTTG